MKTLNLFLCFLLFALAGTADSDERLKIMRIRHSDIGKLMDKLYYDAGTLVDVIKYDLRELKRQGENNIDPILKDVENMDCEMRAQWVELDKRRAAIFADILSTPLTGAKMITIEMADEKSGYLHMYWGKLKWSDGRELELSPENFRQGLIRNPSHASKFVKLWPKMSYFSRASVGFDIPDDVTRNSSQENEFGETVKVNEEVKLTICASGYPTHTAYAQIHVAVNGNTIFEGQSPFHDHLGHNVEKKWKVPEKYLAKDNVPGKIWSEIFERIDKLEIDVRNFGAWSSFVADVLDKKTAEQRKGLVYKPAVYLCDWLEKSFLRGMCIRSDTYNYEKHPETEPWYYHNYEYITKAFYDAGINLIYSYVSGKSEELFLRELNKVGIPSLDGTFGLRHSGIKNAKYFSEPEQRVADTLKFMEKKSATFPCLRGIVVDEPSIMDDGDSSRGVFIEKNATSNVATHDKIIIKFKKYIESRREYLEKFSVSIPEHILPVTRPEKASDLPLWMEWQIFKKKLMGNSYGRFSEKLAEQGILTLPIIMDYSLHRPQRGSFVSMGRNLQMISTDLYKGGATSESLSMQLLRHAAQNRAYMTTGAGYSCDTPLHFRRSLITSMIHSDGNLQWTYQYCSKYRDPFAFRKGRLATEFSRDDRYRHSIENWRPEYWGIQLEMMKKMKQADRWLSNTRSVANVAILTSERLAIAKSSACTFFPTFPARKHDIGPLYDWILRRNRPLDIRYIETTLPADLEQYKVIILHGELIITPTELERISIWVEGGGTLIATGETSLYDEWGRRREDFAFSNLFGVNYLETKTGGNKFVIQRTGKTFIYATDRKYVKVKSNKNRDVKARWDNGDPAVIVHESGKGKSVYLSMESFRWAPRELVDIDRFLRKLVNSEVAADPASILNAPRELEVQIRKKGDAYVVHLLDWNNDDRVTSNLKLKLNLPGSWKLKDVFSSQPEIVLRNGENVPLSPFKQYSIICLTRY